MATRLYIPSSGTPAISPAFDTTPWNGSVASAERRQLVTTRINSGMTNKAGAATLTVATFELIYQCLYGPLGAQTVTGSFKGQLRAVVTNSGARYMALRLVSVSADGSTVTEQLARFNASNASSSVPPAYTITTATNRRFEVSPIDTFTIPFSNFNLAEGEYVGLEIGNGSTSNNTPRTGTIVFGDDSGTDLPEDETDTNAFNPWVEFTHNFLLPSGGGPDRLRIKQASLPHRRVYI